MKYTLELPMNLSIQQIEEQVMANADVISHLQGAVPKKIIIVPKKIVNIVV
jgi:leucyl-tRNA synthetase